MQIKTFIFVAESFKRLSFAMREHRQTSSDVWQFIRRSYIFMHIVCLGLRYRRDKARNLIALILINYQFCQLAVNNNFK